MSRGPIVSAILEKDAVEDFRTLIGATNQLMQLKVLFEKHMLLLLEKMQFTVLIVMIMLAKLLFILQERELVLSNRFYCSV
jgi:hypothetical protein